MGTLRLTTKRLVLRPFLDSDFEELRRIGNVPEVAEMMSSIALPWTKEAVAAWVDKTRWRERVGFRLGVFDSEGALIGSVGMGGTPVSLASFIAPEAWGKGYATEAVAEVLRFAYTRFDDLDEIEAEHLNDNPASGHILRKLGFQEVGQSTCKSAARVEAESSTVYRLNRSAHEAMRHEIS